MPPRISKISGIVLALIGMVLIGALGTANARAAISGQLEALELEYGYQPGSVLNPKTFGVDPETGDIFIASTSPEFDEFRIDKLSETGAVEGSVYLPRSFDSETELRSSILGIAIDPSSKMFYVLETTHQLFNEVPTAVASRLLIFSTEPQGGALVPSSPASVALPGLGEPGAILDPGQIAVDPNSHELLISGENSEHAVVLQRLSPSGIEGTRFTEPERPSGRILRSVGERGGEPNYTFALDEDGTTYLIAGTSESPIRGYELPPGFVSGSGPLELEDMPAFDEASLRQRFNGDLFVKDAGVGAGYGAQMVVARAPDGEATLYWRGGRIEGEEGRSWVDGFSLEAESRTEVFGGRTGHSDCALVSAGAGLAVGRNGTLLVADDGVPGEPPAVRPRIFAFGPGGVACPPTNATSRLVVGGAEVRNVQVGTTVGLDAGGSELGEDPTSETPHELEGVVWVIRTPAGTVERIPASSNNPLAPLQHEFDEEGDYSVNAEVTVKESGPFGTGFSSTPKELTVTPVGSPPEPVVTAVKPTGGSIEGGDPITIVGENLSGTRAVQFGDRAATSFESVSATEVRAVAPACRGGSTPDVTVRTEGGVSPYTTGDRYSCGESGSLLPPTVSKVSPNHGSSGGGTAVTISGSNFEGATEVLFGSTPAGEVAVLGRSRIRATAPPGEPGPVDVRVVKAAGISEESLADRFTYDISRNPTSALMVVKAGTGSGAVACDGAICKTAYEEGSSVNLTATAAAGSTFVGWSGGGCTGTSDCVVTPGAATTVTATFNLVRTKKASAPTPGSTASGPAPKEKSSQGSSKSVAEDKAEKIAKLRAKALARCHKLKGRARHRCVMKAQRIGKHKRTAKKKHPKPASGRSARSS